jgi:hypothetical protein
MAQYTGTLEPGDFVVVQDVFRRITQEVFMKDDSAMLDWLGRFVINAYQGGITDNDHLYRHCLEASSSIAQTSSELRLL